MLSPECGESKMCTAYRLSGEKVKWRFVTEYIEILCVVLRTDMEEA